MAASEGRLSFWYLVPPLATLILIWPLIESLPPITVPSNLSIAQAILVVPFYLGLAAAPGWLYAWSGHYNRRALPKLRRWWVAASLWASVLASVCGLVTILAVIPFPAVLGSLVVSVLLLRRFYRSA